VKAVNKSSKTWFLIQKIEFYSQIAFSSEKSYANEK
jgi:hypothetical protein